MTKTNKILWGVSLTVAVVLTATGMMAQPAGMYRQMPGLFVGLIVGFLLDSKDAVFLVTIAINASLYFLILKLLYWLRTKLSANSPKLIH